MIDETGIKRDTRPDASERFMAVIDDAMAQVICRWNEAEVAGQPVDFEYTEHRSSRGIKLLSMKVGRA